MKRKTLQSYLTWGPFRYDEEEKMLLLLGQRGDPGDREICLEWLDTPAELLHTFGQYQVQVWFTPQMAWDFWQAIEDIFDLRSFRELESGQRANPRTVRQILEKYANRAESPFIIWNAPTSE